MRHAWGHKLQRFRLEWPFCLLSILCLYNHKQPGMGTVWILRSVEQHFSTLCAVPQSATLKLYPFRTTCDTTCTFRKTFKLSKSSTHSLTELYNKDSMFQGLYTSGISFRQRGLCLKRWTLSYRESNQYNFYCILMSCVTSKVQNRCHVNKWIYLVD